MGANSASPLTMAGSCESFSGWKHSGFDGGRGVSPLTSSGVKGSSSSGTGDMTVRGDLDFGPVSEGVMRSGRPGGADEASDEIESVDLCFTGFLGRVGDGGPLADGKVDET